MKRMKAIGNGQKDIPHLQIGPIIIVKNSRIMDPDMAAMRITQSLIMNGEQIVPMMDHGTMHLSWTIQVYSFVSGTAI